MKIGDRVFVRGYIDEIRKDTVIVRNDGGYFGTVLSEVTGELPPAQPEIIRCRNCKFASGDSRICMKFGHSPIGELDFCAWADWIPVTEDTPKEAGTYMCTCYDAGRRIVTLVKWQPRTKTWNLTGARAYWKVIAWMPLPEPYRGEDK